jgi:hypothetical protein
MSTDQHIVVFMGHGYRCTRCACAWDFEDTPPGQCLPIPARTAALAARPPARAPAAVTAAPREIVAFAGKKRSGKDTAAEVFVDAGYTSLAFADGIKVMLQALLVFRNCPPDLIERMLHGDLKEKPSRYLSNQSPRYAMQTLGTGWGRDAMDQNFWVNCTHDRINALTGPIVVTDVRRQNEADSVMKRGGSVYRVNRPMLNPAVDEHISEKLISSLIVTGDITNDAATAEVFQARVKKHLIRDRTP